MYGYDYLVDHALKNVWCSPKQDMQMIMKAARLTPFGGVRGDFRLFWKTQSLPVSGAHFHIYQIGQLHPALMGLFPVTKQWVSTAEACNRENLIVDIYAENGFQMPRTETWYMVTENKNLLFAVKEQPRIAIDFNKDDLYFRFYSNAYFNSQEADNIDDFIEVVGGTQKDADSILALQNKFEDSQKRPGVTYAFVNGRYVSQISLVNVKPGDVAEYVYDSSIYKVVEFKVGDLPVFRSELDQKYKYLLHPPGKASRGIDYQDDVDIFLVKKQVGGNVGAFYHRNLPDSLRMVTHRDYSTPTDSVANMARAHQDWGSATNLYLRLQIRKAGYNRPLVNEHNRIRELYKLEEDDILQAMIGVDAVVPNWQASELEKSIYSRIMRSEIAAVKRDLVQEAYGYNAVTTLLAYTPSRTIQKSGQTVVELPYGLVTDSTAYEYDQDGLLLGWYQHKSGGSTYAARNPQAKLIEMIGAEAGEELDEVYGQVTSLLDPAADYRMYRCPILGGVPTNEWEDVTGSEHYLISEAGDEISWLLDPADYYTLVRSNRTVLAYSLDLPVTRGVLKFSLTHLQYRFNELSRWVMQIPMGELDVFMNGRSLIEGLDYFVQFPEIVIVNKDFLINPTTDEQKISIRFSGFCKKDLSRDALDDKGFIDHGLLSNNNRFDLRDDKVLRIVVNGQLKHRDELKFAESDTGVLVPNAVNGHPYLVRDIVVPLRGGTIDHTYSMRAKSQEVDKRIADYMSLRVPAPTFPNGNVIEKPYVVYSPFISRILQDLKSGTLNDERLIQQYGDMDVMDICKPYEHLLAFDPAHADLRPDPRYVDVHPHHLTTVIDLDIYRYRFLAKVVKLYLKDAVSLSHFVRLAA